MRSALLVVWLASLSAAVPGAAQTLADYRLENEGWNGLSSLGTVASHLGARAVMSAELHLDSLGDRDVVWIIYPTGDLPTESLRDWVHGGGRLIVADDFGSSEPLAAEFGLQRVGAPASGPHLYGNPALALVTTMGRHELSDNIVAVATNHPAALHGPGLAVIGWDASVGLMYDMLLGSGRAVFLSDPSVFTNLMMPLRDNAALARNLIVALCNGAPAGCALHVATGDIAMSGGGRPRTESGRALDARLDALRQALADARHLRIDQRATHLIALLLALGASVLLSTVFPPRRERAQREQDPPGSTEFEASIRRFRGQLGERSWELPGAMLREVFEPLIARAFGWETAREPVSAEIRAAAVAWVARWEPGLRGAERRSRIRRIAEDVSRMYHMPRREALLVSTPIGVAERDVRRMFDTLRGMVRIMGADDELRARLAAPD
jgi:hypothetical protein